MAHDSTAPSAPHVQRALAWLAALHGGDAWRAQAAAQASARWREASPRHAAAWAEAERRWRAVAMSFDEGGSSLRTALPATTHATLSRRRALRAAGGGLGALLLGYATWSALPWLDGRQHERQARAARGQHLDDLRLPDGSRLDLAADSAVDVRFGRHERRVLLNHGQVRFAVAREARPFIVATRLGEVHVRGTVFTVADRGGAVRVAMHAGRVDVRAGGQVHALEGDGAALLLHAAGHVERLAHAPGAEAAAPWRSGWWRFVDVPLADAVAEVNAYLSEPIGLDADAAALRITGSFPIRQPGAFVEALPGALPVRLARGAAGWRIERRR
jgi:transmembrane sensor